MKKVTPEQAKQAIKTLRDFCIQFDHEACVSCECPLCEWCIKHCQYMLPESWEGME